MAIYKPLRSTPRVQKAYVPIMVLTVLSVIADVAQLVTTLLYANSIEIQSTNEWVPLTFLFIGLLCKFIGATWFLVAAIADTADHDHTFNLPVFMGFVACCIPPLTILLPFVFLHMLISNNQDIVKRDLIKEKVLLWAWAGCYFFASSVSVFVDFESMGNEDAPTPLL